MERYNFDISKAGITLSEREKKNYELTQFNENIQVLLSKIIQRQGFESVNTDKVISKDPDYVAPHLKVSLGDIHPVVLTVGDPFRCELVANKCQYSKEIRWNREYRIFNVKYDGLDFTVCSHGIGGPGAAICFEELIKVGAKVIIRLGTCGSLKPDKIKQGDLVVSTSACREDGHSSFMVPAGFPAVADPRIVLALYDIAKTSGYKVFMGPTLTSGNFYPGPAMASTLQANADAGALTVEMENASLFCIGTVRGIKTGAVCTVDGSPFNWDSGDYDPHGNTVALGKDRMIITGLKVGSQLIQQMIDNGEIEKIKKESQDDERSKSPGKLFKMEEEKKFLNIFKEKKAFDFIMGMDTLTTAQKSKIFMLTLKGTYSCLQFYLENVTKMTEDQIKEYIILYYKFKKNIDTTFSMNAKVYCETNHEINGP